MRYDGGHRAQPALARLAVGWIVRPVCPEVAAGFGVPRPPIDLVGPGEGDALRVVDRAARRDHTARLQGWITRWRDALEEPIDGAVLKARSPSCGVGDARRYAQIDDQQSAGRIDGRFAAALRGVRPAPALISEVGLSDAARSNRFRWRIAGRAALRDLTAGRLGVLERWFMHLARARGPIEREPADDRAVEVAFDAARRSALQGDRHRAVQHIDEMIDRLSPRDAPYTGVSPATPIAAAHPIGGA